MPRIRIGVVKMLPVGKAIRKVGKANIGSNVISHRVQGIKRSDGTTLSHKTPHPQPHPMSTPNTAHGVPKTPMVQSSNDAEHNRLRNIHLKAAAANKRGHATPWPQQMASNRHHAKPW